MVRRVPRRGEDLEPEEAVADGVDVALGDGRELAPERVERRPVEPARARLELRRVDEVRRADLGDVHLQPRALAHERARGSRVVEVDVREEQVADVGEVEAALGESGLQVRDAGRRAAVEERGPVDRVEEVAPDHVLLEVVEVDRLDRDARRGAHTASAFSRSVEQVVDGLDPDRQPDEVRGYRERRVRGRGVRHLRGLLDEALDAAEALRELPDLRATDDRDRLLLASDEERDHAAEVAHLPGGELVSRMAAEARVEHALHPRVPLEVRRDRDGVLAVAVHPHRERLHAAEHEPRVERSGHRAERLLQEREPLRDRVVVRREEAADDVRVPADVLRRRVEDDVGAERERLLEVRRGEGVVDDDLRARRRARRRPPRGCRRG